MSWMMNTIVPSPPPRYSSTVNTYIPPSYILRQPVLQNSNYNLELAQQQTRMTLMAQEQYFKYTQQLSNLERQTDLKQRQRSNDRIIIKRVEK